MLCALNTNQQGHIQPSDLSLYKISMQSLLSITHNRAHTHRHTPRKESVSHLPPPENPIHRSLSPCTAVTPLSGFAVTLPPLKMSARDCEEEK